MLPDIESLRCFHAAAQQLNFRLAARAVGLSPAAFGDRIKRLEELFEVRLFERTTRRVTLTPSGERLWPQARRCLDEAERCCPAARGDLGTSPFSLTVGTRYELGMSWVTPALTPLSRTHPERTIHLWFGDTAASITALVRNEIDCVITSARITSAGLKYARLHEEGYVFVGSRKLLQKTPIARREHAKKHTLIEINDDLPLFRYFLDARPGDEIWSFKNTEYLGTIGPIRARVLEGAGVAVLPHYFVEKDIARDRLVRIMPRVSMPVDWFRLVWHKDHPRQDALHELAGELSEIPLK